MNISERKLPRPRAVQTEAKVGIGRQVSVGLIALSLSLISLALGAVFFSLNGPAAFLLTPNVTIESTASSATAVTLLWTAPGDDNTTGQAASYDLRYSSNTITSGNFSAATSVSGEPVPQVAGGTESMTVTSLSPATTYFFALTATDEAGNVSAVSNVATVTTDALPVACIPIYQCSNWSVCSNSVQTRVCTVTNGCAVNLDQPMTSQSCTMPVVEPTPPPTGGGPVSVLKHIIASGVGPGTIPVVRIINPATKKTEREFVVFRRSNLNGTNVDVGDIDGNRLADVLVGSGAGSDPLVKVYSASGVFISQFNPYPTSRGTGVDVAAGDVDGDGIDEVLTIPAKSAAQLRIFKYDPSAKTFQAIAQTFVYSRDKLPGFTVAADDLDLDGRADIVVAPRADGRTVTVLKFTSTKTIQKVLTFSPYATTFRSGLTVSIGDTDGNGRGEILTTSGPGYYSHVKVFDMAGHQLRNFLPNATSWLGGVDLTTLDVNADGRDEVITGSYSNGDPNLRIFRYNGLTKKFDLLQNYSIFPRTMQSGLRLGSE